MTAIEMEKSIILSEAGKKGGKAFKHKWTDEERQIVRREYKGTNASTQWIASYISHLSGERITFFAVKGQVQMMGLAIDKSRRWSNEEIERLYEMVSKYSLRTVAQKLNRSINAVALKAKRLGLSRRFRDGWYTKKDVCEVLGVDHKKVQKWIDGGALKAEWNNPLLRPRQDGMAYWRIQKKHLREFIISNAIELTGRNVDIFYLVEILC